MNSTRVVFLLVISWLLALTSGKEDEWDQINTRPNGRSNLKDIGMDFIKILEDVEKIGKYVISGLATTVLGGGPLLNGRTPLFPPP